MRNNLCYIPLSLAFITLSSFATTTIESFISSHSYSNVLPVKQLIEDDWQQSPDHDASKAFTQNEAGIRAYIDNFSLSISHRYDYFVDTNHDTAQAFYLDRQDQALNAKAQYDINLKLFHQRSKGIKLGYKLDFDTLSTELRIGYWRLTATRESKLYGTISSDLNNNIAADAQLNEFYSDNNFLKRKNTDDWETDGSGITADFHLRWKPTSNIDIALDITDLYSHFKLEDSGFSEGKVNTNGTFINSLGGVAYLPLYRGLETSAKHTFSLPKTMNIDALYRSESLAYLAHFTRQGDTNFYYLGLQFEAENSTTRLLFDVENRAPEVQFKHRWITAYLSMDDIDLNQAMLLKLGLGLHIEF
jgi:hypothetical protein